MSFQDEDENGYELNETERDIQPGDFRKTSFWKGFVKRNGAGPMIDLIDHAGGGKFYIPSYDFATKSARKRARIKSLG